VVEAARATDDLRRTIKLGIAQRPCRSLTSTGKPFRKLGTRLGRNNYLLFDRNRTPSTSSRQTARARLRAAADKPGRYTARDVIVDCHR